MHSRATLGFEDFSKEEAVKLEGAIHPLVHTIPGSGRKSLYIASHASKIIDWPVPDGRLLLLDLRDHADPAAVPLHARLGRRRPRDLGQPLHHAPRPALRGHEVPARAGARHHPGRAVRRAEVAGGDGDTGPAVTSSRTDGPSRVRSAYRLITVSSAHHGIRACQAQIRNGHQGDPWCLLACCPRTDGLVTAGLGLGATALFLGSGCGGSGGAVTVSGAAVRADGVAGHLDGAVHRRAFVHARGPW